MMREAELPTVIACFQDASYLGSHVLSALSFCLFDTTDELGSFATLALHFLGTLSRPIARSSCGSLCFHVYLQSARTHSRMIEYAPA